MEKPVPTPQEAQEKRTKDLFFKALELSVGTNSPVPKEPKFKTPLEERGEVPPPAPTVEETVTVGDSLASMLTRGKLKDEAAPEVPLVEEKKEEPVAEKKDEVVEEKKPLGEVPPPVVEKKDEKKVKPKPIPVPEIDPVVQREAPEAPVEVDVGDVSDLSEDELHEVDLAKFAERTNPAKYTGRAKAVLKYIRDHRKLAQELANEDPDGDVASNPKYQRFVKSSRPEFSAGERNRLTMTKIKEEAKRELQAEMEEKYMKPLEQDLRQQKVKPAIQKTVDEFTSQVAAQMPDEDDSIVKEVTGYIKGQAKLAAEEFLSVSASIKPFDAKNPTHAFLANFIEDQGQQLVTSKSPYLKRGTQTFLPRAQFNSLPPAERVKHFTFTDEDVLQMLVVNARTITENAIKEKREYMESLGYTKTAKAAAKPKEAPVVEKEEVTPKASLSSSSAHTPVPGAKKKNPFLQFVTDEIQGK